MSEFYVGQKVVCVDADSTTGVWDDSDRIFSGSIYTITAVFIDHTGTVAFHLREVRRSPRARSFHGDNVGYGAFRFRPLVSKSVELFRQIARDVTEGKKVRIRA